ncbi:Plug domain-containing protein [Dysgonomonas sp. 25]|uniref:Plug domain-containing protein n=1 Tax=Dysgonomonas sp. 25 TaxID=2302933 RepID=UPI0013D7A1E2|nr:Plug domain-containing protein [Dysgonomonas sp. 25]NDV67930.1 hypothetical protein [Dysgonomonas sp. 25]
MLRILTILILLTIIPVSLWGQNIDGTTLIDSVNARFERQVSQFPQEKIHVQSDRNKYISGEKIFFKAYLVSALSNRPAYGSRYIYVELISPTDSIAERVKIRPDSLGLFHGYLNISEDIPEGHYRLRAYTQHMRNMDHTFFFNKPIEIYHPLSAKYSYQIQRAKEDKKETFQITYFDRSNGDMVYPEKSYIKFNNGKASDISFGTDAIGNIPVRPKDRAQRETGLLETKIDDVTYKHYVDFGTESKDFEVTFFPEGGYIPIGNSTKVAFKALDENGNPIEIKGVLYDQSGKEIQTFETTFQGMGSFIVFPLDETNRFYAECTDKQGTTKRFEMPKPENCYTINILKRKKQFNILVQKSQNIVDNDAALFLLIHLRGRILLNTELNASRKGIVFQQDNLPSGVVHVVLYNSNYEILSERLIFSLNEKDLADTEFSTSKRQYKQREAVEAKLKVTDYTGKPLTGDLSVAIVNSNDLKTDSTQNIISTLLLNSDLKGDVRTPLKALNMLSYPELLSLDLIMLTHGWRKYNIPEVIKGTIAQPEKYPFEDGQTIKGKVTHLFKGVRDATVTIMAVQDTNMYFDSTVSDKEGFFELAQLEYPEKSELTITAVNPKGKDNVVLDVTENENFSPVGNNPFRYKMAGNLQDKDKTNIVDFVGKADAKWAIENGIRSIYLAEVEVKAKRKSKSSSRYYSAINTGTVITSEEIEKYHINDMRRLILTIPFVDISNQMGGPKVTYRNSSVLLVVDDVLQPNIDVFSLDVNNVESAFLMRPEVSNTWGLGGQGRAALIITTKRGKIEYVKESSNVKHISLLSYQQPIEFYSPKYETNEEKASEEKDLRTTIYWKPDVHLDKNGEAQIKFYTADSAGKYDVIIEGMSSNGELIHKSTHIAVSK